MADQQITDVYVAIVGAAGAGKDCIISTCTGKNYETSVDGSQDLSFIYNSATRVHLIDIPGFTDADKEGDNTGAQETALARINALISTGKPTSGIISLHPITNKYNTGLVLRNIELSRELCGPNAEAHSLAVLATSI